VILTVVTYFEADNLYKKFKYCVNVLNILKTVLTSIYSFIYLFISHSINLIQMWK